MSLMARIAPSASLTHVVPELKHRAPPKPLAPTSSFIEEVVVLSSRVRVGLWLLLFVVVVVNIALLTATALVYHAHDTRGSPLWIFRIYFLSYTDGAFLRTNASAFSAGYLVLAILFALYALQLVGVSVKRKGFHFGAQRTTVATTRRVSTSRSRSFVALSTSYGAALYRRVAAIRFLVSVRGPYFDLRLLVDDTLEVVSQTAAAYASSRQISSVALNLGYGIVICLTCLCPWIFEHVFCRSFAKRRMACLVTDFVLDFVWGTLLPLWTAVPVVRMCMNLDPGVAPDNTVAISRQIERVVVLSWPSFALIVIPFVATLLNLIEIQAILREVYDTEPTAERQARTGPPLPVTVVLKLRHSATSHARGHVGRLLHALLRVYGVTALLVTIAANSLFAVYPPAASCIHRVYPWFTTHESCVGRRINCTAMGITGTGSEIEHAIDAFSGTHVLSDLVFSSCPVLTIPRRITQLEQLETLAIYHSHLVHWDADAALVATHFPVLRAVHLTAVTFEVLPVGLTAQPLSRSVDWIHLDSIANATELLAAAGDHWNYLRFFDCMACELAEFPAAIKAMHQLSMLALSFNAIYEIPENWNVNADSVQLDAVWLDVNPNVATLPESFWRQTATLEILSLEATGLTTVPDWLGDVIDHGLFVFAANTPLCAAPTSIAASVRPLVLCETVY